MEITSVKIRTDAADVKALLYFLNLASKYIPGLSIIVFNHEVEVQFSNRLLTDAQPTEINKAIHATKITVKTKSTDVITLLNLLQKMSKHVPQLDVQFLCESVEVSLDDELLTTKVSR